MDSLASTGNGGFNRGVRRTWTIEEERVLLNGLKDLIVQGWTADNGFHGDYTMVLENHMQQHFPGMDIKVEPHISSEIKVWKKYYGALVNMQGRSGFGWDNTRNTITVKDDDIWNDYLKVDRNAKGLRNKSFPYFKYWVEIFCQDRATGEGAQSFADVVEEDMRPVGEDNEGNGQDLTVGVDNVGQGCEDGSGTQGESSATSRKKKQKKRKTYDNVELRMVELMESFCPGTRSGLEELAQRVRFQQDTKDQRKAVPQVLQQMTFLSVEEKLAVTKSLCKNNEDLDIFFSVPYDEQEVMVRMLLDGRM